MTVTFKLWLDSDLTVPYSGLNQILNQTSLSDNPQDFTFYFGSAEIEGSKMLRASSNPGVDNITLTPTYILPEWITVTAYVLGTCITPTTPNGYRYECTTAGTSDSGEPTWPTILGDTVMDDSVEWTCRSATHPSTEIKLASTSGGLTGATGGVAMSLGNTVLSGVTEALEVHMRITNTVTTVGSNIGVPELAVAINLCLEDVQ